MKYLFRKKINIFLAWLFDAMGALFFRTRRKGLLENVSSILVIRLDHLGDVFLSSGVPKALKEAYPRARVIFLVSSFAAPLLQNNPFVDELLIYDAPWFFQNRYARSGKSLKFFQLVRLLKEKSIDLGLALRGDVRENLMLWLASVRERAGFGVTGGGFLLNWPVFYRPGVHESRHTLDLLNAIGIRTGPLEPALYFSKEEEASLPALTNRLGLKSDEKYVGLQLGAGSPAKAWPEENLSTFLLDFSDRFPEYRVVFVGSGSQKAGRAVFDVCPTGLSLLGKTTLRELCLLMKRFSFFMGPDSGPAHIAAAMGVRTIFLYSGTNVFEEWKPLEESAVVLRNPVPCSPCHRETCNVDGHPCMAGIASQDVIQALEKILRP